MESVVRLKPLISRDNDQNKAKVMRVVDAKSDHIVMMAGAWDRQNLGGRVLGWKCI